MENINSTLDKLMEIVDVDLLKANGDEHPEIFEDVLSSTVEKLIRLKYLAFNVKRMSNPKNTPRIMSMLKRVYTLSTSALANLNMIS